MSLNKRHGCYRLTIWVNVLLGLAVAFYRLPELGSLAVIARFTSHWDRLFDNPTGLLGNIRIQEE